MSTSRLIKSSQAPMRTRGDVERYCDGHGIPYSRNFSESTLDEPSLKQNFDAAYKLTPLPPTGLEHKGASTVLVFELKGETSNHADVSAAIARKVGQSLATPDVKALYIHTALNPRQGNADNKRVEAVKMLVENQGVPVLHTSAGWNDNYLDFDVEQAQANHFWRVTAFVVDSAGNDGQFGKDGAPEPAYQKHNTLSHAPPLVVHVGAASMDQRGHWHIEGYSSANSPTFLAPVAATARIRWHNGCAPATITGTSAAAPYASGALAALNQRYGSYLTREQILYALLATSTAIKPLNAYPPKTLQAKKIEYKKNAAGLEYNPEYAGFGLIDVHKADRLLLQMVGLTQAHPESITVPTEERVTLLNDAEVKPGDDGLYHYSVSMPPGFALKTTVEAEFPGACGSVSITSPMGTTLPMVMSTTPSVPNQHFSMSTSHGWAGEVLCGSWTINSTTPISRLRLNQHHFLEKDIIHTLNVPQLLNSPPPLNLHNAVPLHEQEQVQRELHDSVLPHAAEPRGLRLGTGPEAKPYVPGDFDAILKQLKKLPSGFAQRHRREFMPPLPYDPTTPGGNWKRRPKRCSTRCTRILSVTRRRIVCAMRGSPNRLKPLESMAPPGRRKSRSPPFLMPPIIISDAKILMIATGN